MGTRAAKPRLSARDLELCAQAADACACFNFRKASRVVTQLFDEALAPSGLRSTQVVILMAVALNDGISVGDLADALVMDRTTLTRNLKPLEKQGFLVLGAANDRRKKLVSLRPGGAQALRKALPLWQHCQKLFVSELGATEWKRLERSLKRTVEKTGAITTL